MSYRMNIVAKPLALLAFIVMGGWIVLELWATDKTVDLKKIHYPTSTKKSGTITTSDTRSDDHVSLIRTNATIKSLEARLDKIEKKMIDYQAGTSENISGSQEMSESTRPTPEEINEETQARLDRLDYTFNGEPIDSAWSGNTESKLTELILDHIEEGSNLSSLECRENACRMEISHNSAIQSLEFEQILKNQSMSYYLQNVEGEEGEHISIGYFVRKGITMDDLLNQPEEDNQ